MPTAVTVTLLDSDLSQVDADMYVWDGYMEILEGAD